MYQPLSGAFGSTDRAVSMDGCPGVIRSNRAQAQPASSAVFRARWTDSQAGKQLPP
jgi:hypothetical protein